MPTLYLFADSNLFLHYKSLKQIDWLRLGNCDDIKVVVLTCPPRTGPGVMLVLGLKERGVKMARRKHTAEQIINKLREAEVAIPLEVSSKSV